MFFTFQIKGSVGPGLVCSDQTGQKPTEAAFTLSDGQKYDGPDGLKQTLISPVNQFGLGRLCVELDIFLLASSRAVSTAPAFLSSPLPRATEGGMADSRAFAEARGNPARPGAGIISRIRLENFMCHSSLEIEFGDWVNFITGQNGSMRRFQLIYVFFFFLGFLLAI